MPSICSDMILYVLFKFNFFIVEKYIQIDPNVQLPHHILQISTLPRGFRKRERDRESDRERERLRERGSETEDEEEKERMMDEGSGGEESDDTAYDRRHTIPPSDLP